MRSVALLIALMGLASAGAAQADTLVFTQMQGTESASWKVRVEQVTGGWQFTVEGGEDVDILGVAFSAVDLWKAGVVEDVFSGEHVRGVCVGSGVTACMPTTGAEFTFEDPRTFNYFVNTAVRRLQNMTVFTLATDQALSCDTFRTNLRANTQFGVVATSSGGAVGGLQNYSMTCVNASAIPEPGMLALLGVGLFGLALSRRRRLLA